MNQEEFEKSFLFFLENRRQTHLFGFERKEKKRVGIKQNDLIVYIDDVNSLH